MVMANNVYKTLGANAQTLTLLATVCLEDPVTQEKAKTLLDKALTQRPDYIKAVVKKAELLSKCVLHSAPFVIFVKPNFLRTPQLLPWL
jgi:anaphase-promoting complex subunit 7